MWVGASMVQEKYRVRLTAQEKGESPDWVICPPDRGMYRVFMQGHGG